MQIKKATFLKPVFAFNELPEPKAGEIAFAGRSNVGKSSLLNALLGAKIAKVSQTPGKTRSINYFLVNEKYYFVDLPGYGYAKVSKTEKEKWEKLLSSYFEKRKELQMVYVLIDHRHEPQPTDLMMVSWLKDLRIPFSIVLTKADKLKNNEKLQMERTIKEILSQYGSYLYYPTSSEKKSGLKELTNAIGMILGEPE